MDVGIKRFEAGGSEALNQQRCRGRWASPALSQSLARLRRRNHDGYTHRDCLGSQENPSWLVDPTLGLLPDLTKAAGGG